LSLRSGVCFYSLWAFDTINVVFQEFRLEKFFFIPWFFLSAVFWKDAACFGLILKSHPTSSIVHWCWDFNFKTSTGLSSIALWVFKSIINIACFVWWALSNVFIFRIVFLSQTTSVINIFYIWFLAVKFLELIKLQLVINILFVLIFENPEDFWPCHTPCVEFSCTNEAIIVCISLTEDSAKMICNNILFNGNFVIIIGINCFESVL